MFDILKLSIEVFIKVLPEVLTDITIDVASRTELVQTKLIKTKLI